MFKFTHLDLRHFAGMVIAVMGSWPESARKAATDFGESHKALASRLEEFFNTPGLKVSKLTYSEIREISEARLAEKFELVADLLGLLEERIITDAIIMTALQEWRDAKRQHFETVYTRAVGKLQGAGLPIESAKRAAAEADDVRSADAASNLAKSNVAGFTNASNVEGLKRWRKDLEERLAQWVADLAGLESRPEDPDGAPTPPVWRRIDMRWTNSLPQSREERERGEAKRDQFVPAMAE